MTLRIKLSHLLVGLVVGALLVGAGYALASTRSAVIHACVNTRDRALTVPARGRCARGSEPLSWNQQGPRGANGRGATVSVGSVTTESAGSKASVSNSGRGSRAVLNFGIPRGATAGAGATAYGQVWMGAALNSAKLAPGGNSANVEIVGGGDGTAVVGVTGCSSAGLLEPVITVTADHDSADGLSGSNSAGTAAAYVTGWSHSGAVLNFGVSTYNAAGTTTANSDFSFTVYC